MSDAEHEMVVETATLRAILDAQANELAAWRRVAERLLAGPAAAEAAHAIAAEGIDVSA
jgi:hypothetical protein